MKKITVRFGGECRVCGVTLPEGSQAMHERRAGLWCLGCAPTDPEAIREIRAEVAERKASRYEEWAEKRRAKAAPTLARSEHYRGDIAFNTQPGHIPERARLIRAEERAFEHLSTAREFDAKAESIRRNVRVAGDAERRREARRERTRAWIKKGSWVETNMYGRGIVVRVNRKTATIDKCGQSGDFKIALDLSWLSPAEPRV